MPQARLGLLEQTKISLLSTLLTGRQVELPHCETSLLGEPGHNCGVGGDQLLTEVSFLLQMPQAASLPALAVDVDQLPFGSKHDGVGGPEHDLRPLQQVLQLLHATACTLKLPGQL